MADLKITDKIASLPEGSSYFSLEFFPPKTQTGTRNLLPRLQRLAAFQPLFVTVTWGAGGSTAAKSLDLAEICAAQLGLTVCLHLTCTNSSKAVIDEALTRCKELGIRNILALRGDEPRQDEYSLEDEGSRNGTAQKNDDEAEEEVQFVWAVDLVRYIRQQHGDHFCIGVAGYPEGWAPSQNAPSKSPEHDMPYLVEKTAAGADFIMTQLFYDVEQFLRYKQLLLNHESGIFKDKPVIPGLMPVQGWSVLTRTTKLTGCHVPDGILKRLTAVKGDDDEVKRVGLDILQEIIERIRKSDGRDSQLQIPDVGVAKRKQPQAFHFYTLNLEKVVAQLLERCHLIPPFALPHVEAEVSVQDQSTLPNGHGEVNGAAPIMTKDNQQNGTDVNNRVIVTGPSDAESNAEVKTAESEAGLLTPKKTSRQNTMSIAEGEGTLGREATWDDYPNGRWGDARSPAFGSIDGYGPSLHVSHAEALLLWGRPITREHITEIFQKYLRGSLSAIPWSEESLNPETELISEQLLSMTARGWWSMASQPAVNAARNNDPIVGWGPKVGGWVWQKPFVEFFLSNAEWTVLKARLDAFKDKVAPEDGVSYIAGDSNGSFEASEPGTVHPVTWGAFRGKEIITPTMIESESFRAWQEEAFGIWQEWQRVYPAGSPSSKLIESVWKDLVLVNVIGHHYQDGGTLWKLLLE